MLDPFDRRHPDYDKIAGFVPCRDDKCTNDDLHPWHPVVRRKRPPVQPIRQLRSEAGQLLEEEWRCVSVAQGGCGGRGWTTNPCNSCPVCFGRGVIDTATRNKILGKIHTIWTRQRK